MTNQPDINPEESSRAIKCGRDEFYNLETRPDTRLPKSCGGGQGARGSLKIGQPNANIWAGTLWFNPPPRILNFIHACFNFRDDINVNRLTFVSTHAMINWSSCAKYLIENSVDHFDRRDFAQRQVERSGVCVGGEKKRWWIPKASPVLPNGQDLGVMKLLRRKSTSVKTKNEDIIFHLMYSSVGKSHLFCER